MLMSFGIQVFFSIAISIFHTSDWILYVHRSRVTTHKYLRAVFSRHNAFSFNVLDFLHPRLDSHLALAPPHPTLICTMTSPGDTHIKTHLCHSLRTDDPDNEASAPLPPSHLVRDKEPNALHTYNRPISTETQG
jgi:hypothetical protein